MVEGSRGSKGNLMRILNLILKELQELNKGIKELNSSKDNNTIEKEATRFRNQAKDFRKG